MPEMQIIAVISKLRPRVKQGRMYNLDDIANELAEQSGRDQGDARDLAYKFTRALMRHLKMGDAVQLGELGTFRVNSNTNRELKVSYRASSDLKNELATDFRGAFINGENSHLDDEAYAALWLEQNPEDTVVMRDGTVRPLS